MYGVFAPAGEIPMTVAAMFGSQAPSPIGLGHDQGAAINGLPRDAGNPGLGLGNAGMPSVTGGADPTSGGAGSSMPHMGALQAIDPSHPSMWILVGILLLVGAVHLNIGESVAVRAGRRK